MKIKHCPIWLTQKVSLQVMSQNLDGIKFTVPLVYYKTESARNSFINQLGQNWDMN